MREKRFVSWAVLSRCVVLRTSTPRDTTQRRPPECNLGEAATSPAPERQQLRLQSKSHVAIFGHIRYTSRLGVLKGRKNGSARARALLRRWLFSPLVPFVVAVTAAAAPMAAPGFEERPDAASRGGLRALRLPRAFRRHLRAKLSLQLGRQLREGRGVDVLRARWRRWWLTQLLTWRRRRSPLSRHSGGSGSGVDGSGRTARRHANSL